ncbi:MAG: hypothetical protein A2176_11480 [Spirochaetes bacterium RBG_13_51_14]|nr:MAG: hypothetical protein A2176_11480 [Spirochaetes bacterium RBG_13_51_14]
MQKSLDINMSFDILSQAWRLFMKKNNLLAGIILASLVFTPISYNAAALEVDVDEIRSKRVEFINYEGPYKKADSFRDIEDIGRQLSREGRADEPVRFHMKYSIIRAIAKEEPDKFSADIFSIDKNAMVGHIDIIRRITASYLMNQYGYSLRDAKTISLFLSYYNAVHRGDTGYFGSKYKSVVMRHINTGDAGISTRYWEWPGATKMLIPLTEEAQKGRIGSVEPDLLSDRKTIDEIRRDDKNIPDRKDMADLRDRTIKRDREELEKEKKAQEVEKKAIEARKDETKKYEAELKKEKKEAEKIAVPEKRKEKVEEIEKKEKKLEEEKQAIKKKEEETKEKEKTIPDKEEKIKKREEVLKEEKKQIEKDELKRDIQKKPDLARKKLEEKEKELDKREDKIRDKELDKSIYAGKLYYLKVKEYLEGGHYNNDLYMINASTRKIMFKSPVENICGSRYDIYSGGIVIITHRGSHASGHRLTLVDKDTLKAKIYGSDDVFWRSFIEIRDGFIYAVTYEKGRHYLARFDGSLKLVAKSKEELSENTFISFWDNYIYINRLDKTIIVLNKDDLSFIDEVKP